MAGRLWKRIVLSSLSLGVVAYGGVVAWFAAHESSFVYFPANSIDARPGDVGLAYEPVEIEPGDGVRLSGWVIPASKQDSSRIWILYFHGNAGNIGRRGYLEHYGQLHQIGANIFTFDYRGYGESTGQPDEEGLYRDAEAAFRYLRDQKNVPPSRLVLYGYSLGAAVAIDLATKERIAGLILEGAFTSLPDVGQEHYPFLPTTLVMHNQFNSIQKVGQIIAPKLFLHARGDRTIPMHHGKELFHAAAPPKSFLEVNGSHDTAHNVDAGAFYGGINQFLQSLREK